ncbi:MAG: RsmE family RNA methyltransferase [Spirochaetaceae bacterium]
MNLLLLEDDELGKPIPYNDPRARHVREVLRARPGDTLAVGVVEGGKGVARIVDHSREAGLVLGDIHPGPGANPATAPVGASTRRRLDRESPDVFYPVTMLIGHVRPIVLKRLLKDLTTIGVERIMVVPGELGEKSYLESSMWSDGTVRRRLVEGAAQGGVTCLPTVDTHYSLRRALAVLEGHAAVADRATDTDGAPDRGGRIAGGYGRVQRLYLTPAGTPAAEVVATAVSEGSRRGSAGNPPERFIIAVGPERGFTPGEEARLDAAGFAAVSLGRRILRTETAAVLAAGMVSRIFVSVP